MALARTPVLDPRGPIDVHAFSAGIVGTVIRPDDAAYESARMIQNTIFDRRPLLIVRAASAADVARTVVFAREHGLELAVRGGSHSLAGHSTTDGGIVLDLGAMKGLHIDPERRLAWAQPGLTAGEYTAAAAAHGLATPFGDTASVGIGGLTLGGGIGWLVRKYGMTIDSLVAVDIVTADGRLLTASADEHADLFWAVRGGGGNFGVVTRFQFRLHPVATTLNGVLFMPLTADVLRNLAPIASAAPDELTTISHAMRIPPLPFVPADLHGMPALAVMFVYAGDIEAGMAAIEPFRAVARPLAELVAPMPYPGIYEFTKEGETPGPSAFRSVFLDALDDAAIESILSFSASATSPFAMTQIRVLGGAMARVGASETAFAHRDATVMLAIITPFADVAEAPVHEAWTTAYFEALVPGARGVYANFLGDEGTGRVREAYPEQTYQRLAQIKRSYDPTNLFQLNQNIRPNVAS
jgi:FAD/FMN-containing dehydrogenase